MPRFGTQATLEILCAATVLLGVAGLAAQNRRSLTALAPLGALAVAPPPSWSDGTIWTAESAYNLIRVVRQGSRLELLLNSRQSVHTIRDESSDWTGFYYDDFALGPVLVKAGRVLVLGMGGGGSIRATRLSAPDAEFDAVEIDGRVAEAAGRFFGVHAGPRLRIHVADARPWLQRSHERYDLAHVDLYHGGPYVPFYLTTVEFFEQVRAHLSEDGLLMMNVFDPGSHGEVLSAMTATLKQVFPSVMALPAGYAGNRIVFAFARARTLESVRRRFASMEGTDLWQRLARQSAGEIVEPEVRRDAVIFTDDRAPIEAMTRRMLRE